MKFQWHNIAKIINVEEPSPGHFYWLDVDLGVEHPEPFSSSF